MKLIRCAAITQKGAEEVTKKEIKEIIGADSITDDSVVLFEAKSFDEICLLCYRGQSFSRVLLLLEKTQFSSEEGILKAAEDIDFKEYMSNNNSFAVSCERIGEHDFNSVEIEQELGVIINKRTGVKVDLKNPEVPFYAYIFNDVCYIGIDFAGFDLSKRQHRVFTKANELKATSAYTLLRMSGFDGKDSQAVMDLFCGSGSIMIEAALFWSKLAVNFYNKPKFSFLKFKFLNIDFEKLFGKADKEAEQRMQKKKKPRILCIDKEFRNVTAAQKNAKIAGVNKMIEFSRMSADWLDTKLDKATITNIATFFPVMSRRMGDAEKKSIEKLYKEFFYQAEFVMQKKGRIAMISDQFQIVEKYASEYGFRITEKKELMQGKQALRVLIIEK